MIKSGESKLQKIAPNITQKWFRGKLFFHHQTQDRLLNTT